MATVREQLRIATLSVETRAEFEIEIPVRRRQRRKKKAHQPRREVERRAMKFIEDLEAGVPDEEVARRSGLTKAQVQQQRLRFGIKRKPGRQPEWRYRLALKGFADPRGFAQPVDSPVGGKWECPRYMVRKPMSFERFLDMVQLGKAAGRSPADVAAGIGVREQDIAMAWVLGDRL